MRRDWARLVARFGCDVGCPLPQHEGEPDALVTPENDFVLFWRLQVCMPRALQQRLDDLLLMPVQRAINLRMADCIADQVRDYMRRRR